MQKLVKPLVAVSLLVGLWWVPSWPIATVLVAALVYGAFTSWLGLQTSSVAELRTQVEALAKVQAYWDAVGREGRADLQMLKDKVAQLSNRPAR